MSLNAFDAVYTVFSAKIVTKDINLCLMPYCSIMRTNKRRVAPNINSEMGACISKQQPLPIYTQIEETINLKDLYHSSRI